GRSFDPGRCVGPGWSSGVGTSVGVGSSAGFPCPRRASASGTRSAQYSSTFSAPPAASTSARKAGLSSTSPPSSAAPARYATHRPSSDGDGPAGDGDGDASPVAPVVGAAWVAGGGSAGGAEPRPEIGLGI